MKGSREARAVAFTLTRLASQGDNSFQGEVKEVKRLFRHNHFAFRRVEATGRNAEHFSSWLRRQCPCRGVVGHDPSTAHDHHAVGEARPAGVRIVDHSEQHRRAAPAPRKAPCEQLMPRIERRGRLVGEQDLGLGRQCASTAARARSPPGVLIGRWAKASRTSRRWRGEQRRGQPVRGGRGTVTA